VDDLQNMGATHNFLDYHIKAYNLVSRVFLEEEKLQRMVAICQTTLELMVAN
jgi:hypothetical protein